MAKPAPVTMPNQKRGPGRPRKEEQNFIKLKDVPGLPLSLSPAQASCVAGIGVQEIYRQIKNEEIYVIQVGRDFKIPTIKFLQDLGLFPAEMLEKVYLESLRIEEKMVRDGVIPDPQQRVSGE